MFPNDDARWHAPSRGIDYGEWIRGLSLGKSLLASLAPVHDNHRNEIGLEVCNS